MLFSRLLLEFVMRDGRGTATGANFAQNEPLNPGLNLTIGKSRRWPSLSKYFLIANQEGTEKINGTPYPLEKKNQILGRILSKEITVEQAHREYSIATSCVYRWLRQLKADGRSGGQGTQAIPLPQGMNFRAALVAEGYCQEVGFESPAAGKFCRTKGVTLDEIKRFSTWLAQHDDDVVLSASARAREQELINKVTALSEEQKQQNRELQRKEKALAEAAALLVLTKKAQAIWGDKEK